MTIGLREVFADRREFIRRLVIENHLNEPQRIGEPWEEQLAYLDALLKYRMVVGLKPRQVGFTTIALAYFFVKTFTAPNARRVLNTVQDLDTMDRCKAQLTTHFDYLPLALRTWNKRGKVSTRLRRDSRRMTEFGHNGGSFRRLLAGARGQGRSGTYNDIFMTEVAYYPASSSATHSSDSDTDTDTDLLASIDATVHDPEGQIVMESTGNGPSGMFYQVAMSAMITPGVGFVFIPWFAVPRYEADVPPGMMEELTPDEIQLIADFGPDRITPRKLAWRRSKLTGPKAMSLARFQREFPSTPDDPFRIQATGWFNQDHLNTMMAGIPPQFFDLKDALRVYYLPEPGRKYVIGVDTSGGVGRDEAAIAVLRDDLVECAAWVSKWADVPTQAQEVARLFGLFRLNGAADVEVIVEGNKFGLEVIERIEALGVRTWKDDRGGDFYSTGGQAGATKRAVMVHAQENLRFMQWNDPVAVKQAANIVEKRNGKIENRANDGRKKSPLDHDDRTFARCLALWAFRGYLVRARAKDPVRERATAMKQFAAERGRRVK